MPEFHPPAPDRDGVRRNIGTLWTLTRAESSARCALVSVPTGLEVRVMLDGAILRAEGCKQYSGTLSPGPPYTLARGDPDAPLWLTRFRSFA